MPSTSDALLLKVTEDDEVGRCWLKVPSQAGIPAYYSSLDCIRPFVESERYQEMSDEMKGVMMERLLKRVRGAATAQAAGERPDLYRETREGRLGRRRRDLRRSLSERSQRLEAQRQEMQ